MSAFAVIAILYTTLSFIFITERTGLFWAGLSFFLAAAVFSCAVTVSEYTKRGTAFWIRLLFIIFSFMYLLTVLAVNIIFSFIFKSPVGTFISVQLLLLAIYIIIILMLFITKRMIKKAERHIYALYSAGYDCADLRKCGLNINTWS